PSKHGRGRPHIATGGATFFAPRAAPASGTRRISCAAAWRRSMTTFPSASASDNSLRSNPRAGRCSRRAAARGSPARRLPRWCRRPNFMVPEVRRGKLSYSARQEFEYLLGVDRARLGVDRLDRRREGGKLIGPKFRDLASLRGNRGARLFV